MDALTELLYQSSCDSPEGIERYVIQFDVIVRTALGVPSADALPLPFVPIAASPDPATAGPPAE